MKMKSEMCVEQRQPVCPVTMHYFFKQRRPSHMKDVFDKKFKESNPGGLGM